MCSFTVDLFLEVEHISFPCLGFNQQSRESPNPIIIYFEGILRLRLQLHIVGEAVNRIPFIQKTLHLQSTAYESSTVDRMMIHWAGAYCRRESLA